MPPRGREVGSLFPTAPYRAFIPAHLAVLFHIWLHYRLYDAYSVDRGY